MNNRAIDPLTLPRRPGSPVLADALLVAARVHTIAGAVMQTLLQNQVQVERAKQQIADWMLNNSTIRILGAGRALLAASMPGNRLAHAGAQVSFMGGMVPLPNSRLGGGIIACSASGKTKHVLEAMAIAKSNNREIVTIGIANSSAVDFGRLCDIFIGLRYQPEVCPNPLSALADTEEYMIAEILDGLVVLAGRHIGFDDEAWRRGHEDIGPTGPYAPLDKKACTVAVRTRLPAAEVLRGESPITTRFRRRGCVRREHHRPRRRLAHGAGVSGFPEPRYVSRSRSL